MERLGFVLLAGWALVVSPRLCEAKVLVACCAHEERPTGTAHGDDSCCRDEAPRPANPAPIESECGSCAGLCLGWVKPPERPAEAGPSQDACHLVRAVRHGAYPRNHANPIHTSTFGSRLNRPYPPSDLPLLI